MLILLFYLRILLFNSVVEDQGVGAFAEQVKDKTSWLTIHIQCYCHAHTTFIIILYTYLSTLVNRVHSRPKL